MARSTSSLRSSRGMAHLPGTRGSLLALCGSECQSTTAVQSKAMIRELVHQLCRVRPYCRSSPARVTGIRTPNVAGLIGTPNVTCMTEASRPPGDDPYRPPVGPTSPPAPPGSYSMPGDAPAYGYPPPPSSGPPSSGPPGPGGYAPPPQGG